MYDEIAAEQSVVAVDIDGAHDDFLFLRNHIGDVVHNADVVVADDAQCDGIERCAFSAPAGFDDATIPYTREKQKLAYDLFDADTGELISHHEFEANKYPFMVHAEINALHYARGKVPPNSKLYVIGFPCERCALEIALSGVAEVFVTKDDYDPNSTLNNSRDTAYYMFAQAGILVTICGKRLRPVISKVN